MDEWDFMELSEITALLKDGEDEVGLTQLFRDSDCHTHIVGSQSKSESCSSLTTESRASSPTSDQESIGASEQYSPPTPWERNFLKLHENHSKLISMSGTSTDETFFSRQDPVVWNHTSTPTSSEGPMGRNFLRLPDVKQLRRSSIASPPAKLKGETFVRFVESSIMQKISSYQDDRARSDSQTSDLTRLVQSSTKENVARGRHHGLSSDVCPLAKQRHISCPTSFVASTSGHHAKLLDETHGQSVMQNSMPMIPSSKGKDQGHFHKHSCHATIRTTEHPSDEKQVVVQNSADYHPALTGLRLPAGSWSLGDTISSCKQAIKLKDVMESPAGNTTKAEAQMLHSSVKCRSRSKPGFSTNPRSLTEKTRRKRINERLKELQELVPKSVKGDNIVDMLDQAITYVGNLENQLQVLLVKRSNQKLIDFNSQSRVTHDMTTNSETAKRGKYC